MVQRTLVATPDRSFEGLLVDVAEDYILHRGELDQAGAETLQQALFLAAYYAHHEQSEVGEYVFGDIAYILTVQQGFKQASARASVPLPDLCTLDPPYENSETRSKLLRISRCIRIVTAQTLVHKAPNVITCDNTQGYDYFASVYSSKESDPSRKAEIIEIIKNGDFTIPLMGGIRTE